MSYHPTHRPYTTRDNNNSEWYFKIISLRDEMTQIEDEIALCNDENNIQLLREKISEILLEIEMLEDGDEDDEEQPENEQPENEQPENEQPEDEQPENEQPEDDI